MVESAKTRELTHLSITEHVSQFEELRTLVGFGSFHSTGRLFRNPNEYTDEFLALERGGMNLRVSRGLEVDYSSQFADIVGEFVNREEWDFLLCSVHEFEGGRDIERNVGGASEEEAHARWLDYVRLENLALKSDFIPFHVLSHPVRISRFQATPPEIGQLLDDLAFTAKSRKKALELNGNDISYAPRLVRRLAMACSKAECRVSVGSDAHYPNEVFRNVSVAMSFVDEFGLELLIPSPK